MTQPIDSKLVSTWFEFVDGKIDRRTMLKRASALGIAGTGLMSLATFPAYAQDATPEADHSFTSITSDEGLANVLAHYEITEAENTGGTLVLGSVEGISTFNPLHSSDVPSGHVTGWAFDTLFGIDPVNSEPFPKLLDRWEIAADGVTYTFHLRQDVTWHDGTPFTTDDIVLTFEAYSSPDLGSARVGAFVATVGGWEKIDDHTMTVTATRIMPQIVFLNDMVGRVIPAHIWGDLPFIDWQLDGGKTGADPSRIIGTGPFQIVDVDQSDQTVTLQRYEGYWGKVPYIDQIVLSIWPDTTSAVEALRAGQIDSMITSVSPSDALSLETEGEVNISVYDTFSFWFAAYQLNPERSTLFLDVRTRQALMYALDRESIVNDIFLGFATVAHGPQPVLSPAYAPDEMRTRYEYDVEKAKALLAEVGWADTDGDGVLELDGQKFEFSLIYPSGTQSEDQLVAYMADAFSDVGVAMSPEPVDFATVLLPIVTGATPSFDFDMLGVGFTWDVSGDQSRMFHSSAYPGQFNIPMYNNPEADAALDAASGTTDLELRRELLIEASNIINDDIPAQIIYFSKAMVGYSSRLNNYLPSAAGGYWFLPYVWFTA